MAAAFRWSRVLDVLAMVALVVLGYRMDLAWPYYLGVAIAAGLLIYRHRMVSPSDLSRMGIAFMRINAYVSTTIFVATLIALLVRNLQ